MGWLKTGNWVTRGRALNERGGGGVILDRPLCNNQHSLHTLPPGSCGWNWGLNRVPNQHQANPTQTKIKPLIMPKVLPIAQKKINSWPYICHSCPFWAKISPGTRIPRGQGTLAGLDPPNPQTLSSHRPCGVSWPTRPPPSPPLPPVLGPKPMQFGSFPGQKN